MLCCFPSRVLSFPFIFHNNVVVISMLMSSTHGILFMYSAMEKQLRWWLFCCFVCCHMHHEVNHYFLFIICIIVSLAYFQTFIERLFAFSHYYACSQYVCYKFFFIKIFDIINVKLFGQTQATQYLLKRFRLSKGHGLVESFYLVICAGLFGCVISKQSLQHLTYSPFFYLFRVTILSQVIFASLHIVQDDLHVQVSVWVLRFFHLLDITSEIDNAL